MSGPLEQIAGIGESILRQKMPSGLFRVVARGMTYEDARLFAAAPDLLDALRGFVREHDDVEATMAEPVAGPGNWRCGCDKCVSARAAIAKAEGWTP